MLDQNLFLTLQHLIRDERNAKWNCSYEEWTHLSESVNKIFDKIIMSCSTEADYTLLKAFKDGRTLFHMAAKNGNTYIMQGLLSCHMDPNIPDKMGDSTALHLAARHGNTEVVSFLLEIPNINVTAKETDGYQAIHYAARLPSSKTLVLLLNFNSVGVFSKASNDRTPLSLSVSSRNIENVRLIISVMLSDTTISLQQKTLILEESLPLNKKQACEIISIIEEAKQLLQNQASNKHKESEGIASAILNNSPLYNQAPVRKEPIEDNSSQFKIN